MRNFITTKRKKLGFIDLSIFLFVVAIGFYFYNKIQNTLVYQWRWEDLWGYFFRWHPEKKEWFFNTLSLGLISTLKIILWSFFIALLVGFLLAIMKNSKTPLFRWLAISYIDFVRNIPPLVFLFLTYFFFSSQILPHLGLDSFIYNLSKPKQIFLAFFFIKPTLLENFISGFVSLAFLEAAYMGEIIWAGIRSIERGQWEAAFSLGLARFRVLKEVVLPQAIFKITPALTGQCINLVKDSTILSIISIQELSFSANNVIATSNLRFEVWLTVAAIYFVICFSLSLVSKRLERKIR